MKSIMCEMFGRKIILEFNGLFYILYDIFITNEIKNKKNDLERLL